MSDVTIPTTFEVHLPEPPLSKFERERRSFYQLLPTLLATYSGEYVAIHEGQVVDHGVDQVEVTLRVLRRVGSVPVFVHLVSREPERVYRSGLVRDPVTSKVSP